MKKTKSISKLKKVFNKMKNNILIVDLAFIGINIIINIILNLFNVRFMNWVIVLINIIAIFGIIVGIFQQLYISSDNKKRCVIFSIIAFIVIIIPIIYVMPVFMYFTALGYRHEHITTFDNKKYVATVHSVLTTDVNYYDYYGFFLMGQDKKVHGYFGKSGCPFTSSNVPNHIEYTFYDKNGKETSMRIEDYIKDEHGNVINKNIVEKSLDDNN